MARDNTIAEIIGHAGDALGKLPNYGDVMEQRAGIQARQQALAEHNAAYAQAQQDREKANATDARHVSLGQMAASGDAAGARQGAMAAGDWELVQKLDNAGAEGRKQIFDVSQHTAPLILSLRQVPAEATAQAMQQMAPQLQERGWTPQHITDVAHQLSDPGRREAAFAQIENDAMTIADYQKKNEAYTLSPGEHRFQGGKEVASVAAEPRFILDPVTGEKVQIGGPGVSGPAPSGGAPSGGGQRYTGGWSPRARNGGDNSDSAVDGKIAHLASTLRVDPNADISRMDPRQIASAIAATEGGPGSIADRNNNPGNIKSKSGGFNRYPTKAAGLAAAAALVGRKLAAGQTSIRTMVEGVPAGGANQNAPRRGVDGVPREAPPSGFRWSANGDLEAIPGGPGDKSTDKAKLPKVPQGTVTAYVGNNRSMRTIDLAIKAVDDYPGAVGGWNTVTPEFISQRTDPKGVAARAYIADIGSLLIHDRSGAAVTASEFPRLKPFIPKVDDTPATVKRKLGNLKAALSEMNQDFVDADSNEDGESLLSRSGGRKSQGKSGGLAAAAPAKAHPSDIEAIMKKYGAK